MEFEPTSSFSISSFSYDETCGELHVRYFDGRRKLCAGVPMWIAAALCDSTNPESLLQSYPLRLRRRLSSQAGCGSRATAALSVRRVHKAAR